MEYWSSALLSLVLLLYAGGTMAAHVRTWRRVQEGGGEPGELAFRYRQFRRRMQTSAMLGLLAVALFVGQQIAFSAFWAGIFWGVVLLLAVWIGLLAVADMIATRHHFAQLRQSYLLEGRKLEAEIRRIRASQQNGEAAEDMPTPKKPK